MSVEMYIQFNGKQLILPINPESIVPSRSASNKDIDLIGLGNATLKGAPGLMRFTIESFFPGPNSYFYTGVRPKSAVKFIEEIWDTENINNNVAKLVITGIPIPINMYFVIENFDYEHNAGDEEDIPYTLKIKRYVSYGVKTVDVNLGQQASARTTSPTIQTSNSSTNNTYTVQKGDCLFNITKACTGKGSGWNALYEANKGKINNPNLIYPGQVLTLPEGWQTPKNVTKLKPVQSRPKADVYKKSVFKDVMSKQLNIIQSIDKRKSGGSGSMGGR